jgi:hypothetical protein
MNNKNIKEKKEIRVICPHRKQAKIVIIKGIGRSRIHGFLNMEKLIRKLLEYEEITGIKN